ncbi:MAG TPA: hypothetical protein VJT78_06300 [Candidatus Dormibacteraeota bacterium]|nr:hypothetical protein [Candidatus Dormibacteraeota bacterium]
MPAVDRQWLLLVTVALLSVYVVGVGGSTAAALGRREAWRRGRRAGVEPDLNATTVVLEAPRLPAVFNAMRVIGWIAFVPAMALGVFAVAAYPWVLPFTVVVMVGLNAFYFTAMDGLGHRLTLTPDTFEVGDRRVQWIHVTDLTGAHIGAFRAGRMSEAGEWQDPKLAPNVVFYRLNRALVQPRKSIWQRLTGLTYFDGMIRNTFGVTTEQLLRAMRDRQRRALDAQGPPLGRRGI